MINNSNGSSSNEIAYNQRFNNASGAECKYQLKKETFSNILLSTTRTTNNTIHFVKEYIKIIASRLRISIITFFSS